MDQRIDAMGLAGIAREHRCCRIVAFNDSNAAAPIGAVAKCATDQITDNTLFQCRERL
jgi:hypothetical protein